MHRRTLGWTTALAAVFAASLALAAPMTKMNKVLTVAAESGDDAVILRIKIQKKTDIAAVTPEVIPASREVRFQLADTYIAPSRKTFRQLGAPELNRVFAFQVSQSATAFKVVTSPSLKLTPERVTVETGEDEVIVRLWKTEPVFSDRLAAQMDVVASGAGAPTAAEPTPVGVADDKPPIDLDRIFAKAPETPVAATSAEPAAEPAREETPADGGLDIGSGAPSLGTGAVKMLSALLGVLALIATLAYLARRTLRGSIGLPGQAGAAPRPLRVIATAPLGLKKQVSLIEVAGQLLVLGVSESSVNLLARVDDEDVRRRLLGGAASAAPAESTPRSKGAPEAGAEAEVDSAFARELARYREVEATKPDDDGEREDALKAIRDRLANMKRLS